MMMCMWRRDSRLGMIWAGEARVSIDGGQYDSSVCFTLDACRGPRACKHSSSSQSAVQLSQIAQWVASQMRA